MHAKKWKSRNLECLVQLYSCKSIAMKFSTWYPMTLAIKRMHNLQPHLDYYVSTLPHITQKPKIHDIVFFSIVWVVLKKNRLAGKWLWKKPVMWLDHSRCSKWRPFTPLHIHTAVFITGQWLCRWCREEYCPKCQCFSLSVSRFSFCVMSGSAET